MIGIHNMYPINVLLFVLISGWFVSSSLGKLQLTVFREIYSFSYVVNKERRLNVHSINYILIQELIATFANPKKIPNVPKVALQGLPCLLQTVPIQTNL